MAPTEISANSNSLVTDRGGSARFEWRSRTRPGLPLVVDLDGTLTPIDTLVESVLKLLRNAPLAIFEVAGWLMHSRARLKENVAARVTLDIKSLPWRQDLLSFLARERRSGRWLILATASDRQMADAAARYLGLFDDVLASDGERNLKGKTKLTAIEDLIRAPFVYAADSDADMPVWQGATGAILVGDVARLSRKVSIPVEKAFADPSVGLLTWLRALRIHHYAKNLLVFVPLLTSFAFTDLQKVAQVCVLFMAFCLVASATYVANDLADLENDRAHARKRERPFASGRLSALQGMAAAGALHAAGLGLAACVSVPCLLMLLGYVGLTTAYSWALKRFVLVDVLCLAMLYMWRVLAGAIAASVVVSPWLLAFSVFIFASLALVKRCAELVSLQQDGAQSSTGRNYGVGDLVVLWPLGVCLAVCSVVVFGLYVGSLGATSLYANSQILWLVGLCLLYWIGRLWIKTARGEMHDDPLVFAMSDAASRVTLSAMVVLTVIAHFVR